MRLMYEKVLPTENSSWRFWLYEIEELPFNWHYHPEYEIALTLNSHGQRYVGDSIENYESYDLAFLGPHVPHTWCSASSINGQPQQVYVAQIPVSWFEGLVMGMPDLSSFKDLLIRSRKGLKFSTEAGKEALKLFEAMHEQNPAQRFVGLLNLFDLMINDSGCQELSSSNYGITITADGSTEKLDTIIRYIHDNYTENIKAEDVAKLVFMSTNHFHRFVKQRTEQTFTEIVNQRRISKACSLLINSQKPVSTISDMCGFNNISNFNRRFLQFKNLTPSEFRQSYQIAN